MTDIIDLNERRNASEKPDADCVRKDDYGRQLYLFTLAFEFEDREYGVDLWAYSMEDASAKVAAMRESVKLLGQLYSMVPA
jgi:hypothetical protein